MEIQCNAFSSCRALCALLERQRSSPLLGFLYSPSSDPGDMLFFFRRAFTPKPDSAFIVGLEHLQVSQIVTTGTLKDWGGFADVYEGWMKAKGSNHEKKVAIKKIRVRPNSDEKEKLIRVLRFN